jgi:predicted dehydrogenase
VKIRIALNELQCQTTHRELDDPWNLRVRLRTAMSEPFRIALIGIDHPHGAAWRELFPHVGVPVEVAAIVPAFGGAISSLEEKYARVPRFETIDQLLGGAEFDGALVCLSNRETPGTVRALAVAGKHVLMEKPGSASLTEVAPAIDAVRAAGVSFQNGYLWRYDPGAERIRSMIGEGRFGKVISIEIGQFTADVARRGKDHYLFDAEQSGRGFYNWLGCHWLDILPFLTGDRVTAVTARVGCLGSTAVPMDDGGTVILELGGGTLVTITGGYWLPRWTGELKVSVRGSERWVRWEPAAPGTGGRLTIHGPQPHFHAMEETFDLPLDRTPGYGGARGVATIRDWISQARSGRPGCRNTLDSTLETLRLLDAVYRSSDEGRRICL